MRLRGPKAANGVVVIMNTVSTDPTSNHTVSLRGGREEGRRVCGGSEWGQKEGAVQEGRTSIVRQEVNQQYTI